MTIFVILLLSALSAHSWALFYRDRDAFALGVAIFGTYLAVVVIIAGALDHAGTVIVP